MVTKQQQTCFIKSKLFRKSELIDLISAVDKLSHDHPLFNEMQIKKEKMQAELLVVEDELFELSKK